ncbi:hypothetical protein ABVT39_027505 [Epinephelus coioides]
MGETVSKEWLLENEVSVGDTTLHKSLPEERPGDYEGQEKEGEVGEGYLEKSKIEGEGRNKTEDKIKGQKTQKEALEKIDSDGEEGQKADEKRQEETLEKMEGKSERGKKRETTIQEKTLENMEGKSEKRKKRETKIQEKTLENMEGKSEKGKTRETKIQDEPAVMTRSKVKELQKRKIKEEHLQKSERESGEGSSGVAQTWKMPLKRKETSRMTGRKEKAGGNRNCSKLMQH